MAEYTIICQGVDAADFLQCCIQGEGFFFRGFFSGFLLRISYPRSHVEWACQWDVGVVAASQEGVPTATGLVFLTWSREPALHVVWSKTLDNSSWLLGS